MTEFFTQEDGAVTVDWVVMTAALVGLGLATMAVVDTGVESQSNDIKDTLTGIRIVTAFDTIFSSNDFSDGRGDWTGGELMTVTGFGEILALSGSADVAELPIDIGNQHAYAVVEFDMIIADSWDNEQGSISINGEDVVIGTHAWRNDAPDIQTFSGSGDTSVTLTRTSTGTGGNWRPGQDDFTYSVRVVAANDGSELTLGAATTLGSGASDEFFGIDNVEVSGANSID